MEAGFPVRVLSWLNSFTDDHRCISWSISNEGTALIEISDNAAFSVLYGHQKSVWLRQFASYSFKKIFHGQTHQQRRTCTIYSHPDFRPDANIETIRKIARVQSTGSKERAVSFESTKTLHNAILQRSAYQKGEMYIAEQEFKLDDMFFSRIQVPMQRRCSFDDFDTERHEFDLLNDEIITTPFIN